jgi:general secretion pathway protein G
MKSLLKYPKRHGGFTLTELLVVIAIIAVLASLGFVGYRKMIERARTSKCASNQRDIVAGMLLWTQENNNILPVYNTSMSGGGGFYWYAEMSRNSNSRGGNPLPYCGHNPLLPGERDDTVWICPANNPFKTQTGQKRDASYGIASSVFANAPNSTQVRLASLNNPSNTVAFCDWNLNGPGAYKITSDSDIAAPHNGACNVAFIDGHVQSMKPKPSYNNPIFKRTGGP